MDKLEILLVKFTEHMKVINFSDRTLPDYTRNVRRFLDYLRSLRDRKYRRDGPARTAGLSNENLSGNLPGQTNHPGHPEGPPHLR